MLCLVALGLCLSANEGRAHGSLSPFSLRLELAGHRVRVALRWDVAPGPEAQALREQFDRSHDGRLGAKERAALASYLARRAMQAVVLEVNDQALPLVFRAPRLWLMAGGSARITVTLAASGNVAWRPGENQVSVRPIPLDPSGRERSTATPIHVAARSGPWLPHGFSGGEALPDAPLRFVVKTRRGR